MQTTQKNRWYGTEATFVWDGFFQEFGWILARVKHGSLDIEASRVPKKEAT